MTASVSEMGHPRSLALQVAIRVAVVIAASAGTTVFAWFLGLDWLWAGAAGLALGSIGAVLATLKFEQHTPWDPPGRETPRGIRLAIPMMEESLAACDRLARPVVARRIRSVVIEERDDRLARGTMLRQMRALLVAELRVRGVDPAHQGDEAIVALLGPDALTVLQPSDDNPVTSAAIANCLDAVERLQSEPPSSQ